MAIQHLRSSTANKRPTPAAMSDGQLAINSNTASPGLFFKDSAGALIKIGPVHVGSTAPNASPAAGGETGNTVGEQWLDTSSSRYVFKIWDGTTWRTEDGEFVNSSGDTMTGALVMDNQQQIRFREATANGTNYIALQASASVTSDKTITLPDVTGTVVTTGDTGSVTSTMILDGTIVDGDISATAEIAVSKLADGTARQLLQTDAAGTGVEWASNIDIPGTLDVTGAATLDSTLSVPLGSAGSPSIYPGTDTNTGIYSPGADQLAISTGGTGRLFVDASGNIAVGNATTNNRFLIYTVGANNSYLQIGNGSTGLASTQGLRIGTPAAGNAEIITDGLITFGTGNAERARIRADGMFEVKGAGTAGSSPAFSVSGSAPANSFVIDSSGNVGIGTTSPGAALHVRGASTTKILLNSADNAVSRGIYFASSDGTELGYLSQEYSTGFLTLSSGTGAYQTGMGFSTAGSTRVVIDSSGRLLVGTTSAATAGQAQYAKLRVVGNTASSSGQGHLNIARGTAASSGIGTDTEIGYINFTDSSGYDFAQIVCSTDAAASSGDYPGRLVFSTTADGAASPTPRMTIDSSGNLLVGQSSTSTPGVGNTTAGHALRPSGDAFHSVASSQALYLNTGTDGSIVDIRRSNTTVGSISVTTSATAYNTSSDYRLKENVVPLTGAIDRVNQLQVHRFNFIADPDKTVDGFIAHEAQTVVPECITGEKDAVDDEGNPVYQGIDQSKLVPLLTAALQEALAEIESLKARVAALES